MKYIRTLHYGVTIKDSVILLAGLSKVYTTAIRLMGSGRSVQKRICSVFYKKSELRCLMCGKHIIIFSLGLITYTHHQD